MENNLKIQSGGERKFSQNKTTQELYKGITNINLEDFNQIPQQGKDINFLSAYYNKKNGNTEFMDRIGRLNKKFYTNSERYIKSKKLVEKLNDDLYLNLFQQIDCYIVEIDKLNKKIALNNNQELKKKIEQLNKEISEKNEKIRNLEKKIKEKTINEEKFKKEIESYKRSIIFYKDKINIGILARNRKMNPYGRETNLGYKQKTHKHNLNSFSPTPEKIMNFTSKNKLNKELIYDDEEEKDKNMPIKINKKFKTKESVYYNYIANRTEYDIDGKDMEEKDHESETNFNYTRGKDKSKTIKVDDENKDISPDENSQKFSAGFLNALTEELYGDPNDKNIIGNDSNQNLELIYKASSSDVTSEKKDSNDIEEKPKKPTVKKEAIKTETKGKSTANKTAKLNKTANKNKNENIKSKIIKNNDERPNKNSNKKIELKNDNENTYKKKNIKTATKSKPKRSNKSSDKKILREDNIPYAKHKFMKTFEKEKEKNTPSVKTQLSTESTPIVTSNDKTDKNFKKIDAHQRGSVSNYNLSKKPTFTKKNIGHNSMSNINIINKFGNTSKYNLNKKENSKELSSILNDVNDDYLKSIEMLRKQEEQIKYMLRFIELDDEN